MDLRMVIWTLVAVVVSVVGKVAYETISFYWLTPRRIRRMMDKQGVRGPNPRCLIGNIPDIAAMTAKAKSAGEEDKGAITHDIVPRLLPHYLYWSKVYGKRFIFWNGVEPRMCLMEPELIKELLAKHSKVTGKSWLQRQGTRHFIGRGLLMANGEDWYHQRRLVAPAFMGTMLKSYAGHMVESTKKMVNSLEEVVRSGKTEVEIGKYMTHLTTEIISKMEFDGSYDKGKQILFQTLNHLQNLVATATRHLYFPGSRFVPTKYNMEINEWKEAAEGRLREIIQSRKDGVDFGRSSSYGNDLLGILLQEMHKNNGDGFTLDLQLIMDECKTFFFAGHDTTALLLTWTVMLLATNPDWQDKVRAEVREVCGAAGVPSVHHLSNLTLLQMVINESLRLYPPATLLPRMVFQDIQLGDLHIPKGLSIWIPVLALHHSTEIWGLDANEFNPTRFASRPAGLGQHFIPFAAGPRNCVGQSFALMEAKIILAMLISNFSFTISKNYRHAPVLVLTLKPKYGVQVYLKPLSEDGI